MIYHPIDGAAFYSPDGKLIAAPVTEGEGVARKIKVVLLAAQDGSVQKKLDLSADVQQGGWAPDGRALVYVVQRGAVSNLWSLDISGAAPKQITNYKSDFIRAFAWSKDGKRIAITRQRSARDVVLFADSK